MLQMVEEKKNNDNLCSLISLSVSVTATCRSAWLQVRSAGGSVSAYAYAYAGQPRTVSGVVFAVVVGRSC